MAHSPMGSGGYLKTIVPVISCAVLVQTFGLAQYALAPLLLALAVAQFLKSKGSWAKGVAVSGGLVAAMAISLMLYRQYYQSLGY